MGKHFGNLQKLKGVQYYTLSPHEINPMMMIFPGIVNSLRRLRSVFTLSIVPVSAAYVTYYWGWTTYEKNQRKNPDDFKDDV